MNPLPSIPHPPVKPRPRKATDPKIKSIINHKLRSKQTKSMILTKGLSLPVSPATNCHHTFLSTISEDENQQEHQLTNTVHSDSQFNLNQLSTNKTNTCDSDQISLSDFVKKTQKERSWMTASWNLF